MNEDPLRAPRGIFHGAMIGFLIWIPILAITLSLICNRQAEAQAPPLIGLDTTALEARLLDIERRVAILESRASATPPPATATQPPVQTATSTPTTPPVVAARGLSFVTGWDVAPSQINTARSVGASIIKISASFPHRRTSDLSQSELNRLNASLATVRNGGMKAVVRFSYWYHWDDVPLSERIDAQPAQAHRHVDQLATVINANRDVILVVEAGMVGKWGEWHYHEVTGPQTYGERSLSNSTTGARANLVRKLLDSYQVPVAFRYPRDIRWMWGFLSDSQKSRVAMHNDAVLTESGEWGTFESGVVNGETDQQWLRRVFLATPRIVGGEFAESTDYNDGELTSAFWALAWRQYRYHSWDSGNQPGGIKERLERLGLWDDLTRNLGQWP